MNDLLDDLKEVEITTVQLPDNSKIQVNFLLAIKKSLQPEGVLSELSPVRSDHVFLIPHAAEHSIRRKNKIHSTSEWHDWLKKHGALTVNSLTKEAYVALITTGEKFQKGKIKSPHAISIPEYQQKSKDEVSGVKFLDFVGPYDWHLGSSGINAVAAWAMFAGDQRFQDEIPWKNIRVAHIDTGFTEHAALGWSGGKSSFVHPEQGLDLWDGSHDADGPRDLFIDGNPGHGTRIGAAIAGYYPTAPKGPYYGAAPGVQVIPFRVTDSVLIDHVQDKVRDAIDAAINSNCHIVNISLGALRRSSSLAAILDRAYEKGLIVVCAAGQIWGEVIYPGRFNRCITMGGVGPGLKPWRSAAKGPYVDLSAPAVAIRRVQAQALSPGQTCTKMAAGNGDGTSYATASCSGAAALWLAWHGGIDAMRETYGPNNLWRIPKAFKYLAMQSATPGNWGESDVGNYGAGVLNIAALLQQPLPDPNSMRPENHANGPFDDGSL